MASRSAFWWKIRWEGLFFAALLFLFNGYITFAVVRSYRDQVRAHNTFKPVPAVVLESKVQRVSGHRGSDSFHPYVRYTYEVAGEQYEADRFFFLGIGYNDYAEAQNVVESYPPGASVTVYYDPTAPEVAVLDNSLPSVLPFLIAGVSVFWVANAAVLLYALWPVIKRDDTLSKMP